MKPNIVLTITLKPANTAPAALQVLLIFSPKIPATMIAAPFTTFPIAPKTTLNIVFRLFIMLSILAFMLFILVLNSLILTPHFVSTFFIIFPTSVKITFTISKLLKVSIAPLIVLFITSNGAFIMFSKPDNAPLAMSFNPLSAVLQSPVNTPFTNSLIPLKMVFIFSIKGLIAVTKPSTQLFAAPIAISHFAATTSNAPAIWFTVSCGKNVDNAPITKFLIAFIFVLKVLPTASITLSAATLKPFKAVSRSPLNMPLNKIPILSNIAFRFPNIVFAS